MFELNLKDTRCNVYHNTAKVKTSSRFQNICYNDYNIQVSPIHASRKAFLKNGFIIDQLQVKSENK